MSSEQLYPLSFRHQWVERNWGQECILLSDLPDKDTEVEKGVLEGSTLSEVLSIYLEKIVGESIYYFYGRQFPLMLKLLKIEANYPLYVHPNDIIAQQRYDALGKRKLWYVLDKSGEAQIYKGLNTSLSASDYYKYSKTGKILEYMQSVHFHVGDSIVIDPCEIHSASGSLLILEVSEASDMDFCIYNHGQDEDRVEQDRVEVMDYVRLSKSDAYISSCHSHTHHKDNLKNAVNTVLDYDEFVVNILRLNETQKLDVKRQDSFIVYYCVEGKALVEMEKIKKTAYSDKDTYILNKGELLLIPAESEDFSLISLSPELCILETLVKDRNQDIESLLDSNLSEHDINCKCGKH